MDSLSIFKALRRPNLMIRAARIGVETYRRERDLKRLLRAQGLPTPGTSLGNLLTIEREMEANRTAGDSTYSITRHIEVLTALMAEASLLPRPSAKIS